MRNLSPQEKFQTAIFVYSQMNLFVWTSRSGVIVVERNSCSWICAQTAATNVCFWAVNRAQYRRKQATMLFLLVNICSRILELCLITTWCKQRCDGCVPEYEQRLLGQSCSLRVSFQPWVHVIQQSTTVFCTNLIRVPDSANFLELSLQHMVEHS